MTGSHAWGEESSEEDEEEEDEEEEEPIRRAPQPALTPSTTLSAPGTAPQSRSASETGSWRAGTGSQPSFTNGESTVPVSRSGAGPSYLRTDSPAQQSTPGSGSPAGTVARAPHGGAANPARASIFSNHLGSQHVDLASQAGPGMTTSPSTPQAGGRQTFVQLSPEEQPGSMTAIFQPHGLLQAGAQEKMERSAKVQEAEARQQGVHLVNVPNKPPPPQAGLLGAISAHERDRKSAGGFGATLTERERERVNAERRQREEEAFRQQQQMAMQQMGMGSPPPGSMSPFMNPYMMWGMMPPWMQPGFGGYPGYPGSQAPGSPGGAQDPMAAQAQMQQAAQAQMQAMQAAQMAYAQA